jgi:hypothetical protein
MNQTVCMVIRRLNDAINNNNNTTHFCNLVKTDYRYNCVLSVSNDIALIYEAAIIFS